MYRIIGADGRQYGPVTAEQLRGWIAEGRANGQTQTLAEGAIAWKMLGTLPEFASAFASTVPPAIGPLPSAPVAAKSSAFATVGLIFGILSLTFCCCYGGTPFNILGIIFSVIGLAQAHRNPEAYGGEGQALAGLIISIISVVLFVILFLIGLATGNTNFQWNQWHGGAF